LPSVASKIRRSSGRDGGQPEAVDEHAPHALEVDRPDVGPLDPGRAERALDPRVGSGPLREQEAHRVVALEPAHGERQRLRRRCVQPLDVVDRDEHRGAPREHAERVPEADGDRVRLGGHARRGGTEEGDLERMELRRRQVAELVALHPVEEVDQRREREPRLGVARPRREDAGARLGRGCDRGLPQRRLADARAPAQDHRADGAALGRARCTAPRRERAQQRELLLAADDLVAWRSACSSRHGRDRG
jgi:hypothetical protein